MYLKLMGIFEDVATKKKKAHARYDDSGWLPFRQSRNCLSKRLLNFLL